MKKKLSERKKDPLELSRFREPVNIRKLSHLDLIILLIAIFVAINAKALLDSGQFDSFAASVSQTESSR